MAVVGAIHGPSSSLSIKIKLASIVESKSGTPDRWREGGDAHLGSHLLRLAGWVIYDPTDLGEVVEGVTFTLCNW